jgi:hypothetical protein
MVVFKAAIELGLASQALARVVYDVKRVTQN